MAFGSIPSKLETSLFFTFQTDVSDVKREAALKMTNNQVMEVTYTEKQVKGMMEALKKAQVSVHFYVISAEKF
jgi:N-acetyl-anhydromuramyl-L-alanine amidase AmpD